MVGEGRIDKDGCWKIQEDGLLEWSEKAGGGYAQGGDGVVVVDWAGMREASEVEGLAGRVKDRLVELFHQGAMSGCSALVEVCLQV